MKVGLIIVINLKVGHIGAYMFTYSFVLVGYTSIKLYKNLC